MPPDIYRRRLLQSLAMAGCYAGSLGLKPAWARSNRPLAATRAPGISGPVIDLSIAEHQHPVAGQKARAVLVNGQLPAPLLYWQEGEELTIHVHNHLQEDTSIHWHGILLPFQMDGVPGVSFPGIHAGESFTYRFKLQQAGTYWYHSHSGTQEQLGHYGPIIVEPSTPEIHRYQRDYVIVLSDWTFENPARLFAKLKKHSDVYNRQQRTLADLVQDVREFGTDATLNDRTMWGRMRMNPTDLADVTAETYDFLLNGHAPFENWTGLFQPGETVRLRFINASAMTNIQCAYTW